MSTSPGMNSSHFCRVRLTSGSWAPQAGEKVREFIFTSLPDCIARDLEISGDFHEGLVYIDEVGECSRIARMPVRVVAVRLLLKGHSNFTKTGGINL